jgi:predicted dehydrogenase
LTRRVKVGVVGGGLAAQAIYLPRLTQLSDRFELVSLSEPSIRVRRRLGDDFLISNLYEDWKEQVGRDALEAVIVCAPNGLHEDMVTAAIERQLHCLVEKPICIVPESANRLASAADAKGVVLQVGYMKRHDDATRLFLDAIQAADELPLLVDALTWDPGLRAFFTPPIIDSGGDIPVAMLEELAHAEEIQARSIAHDLSNSEMRCLIDVYLGALIHDVNLLGAVAEAAGIREIGLSASAHWQDGTAATVNGTFESKAPWSSTWLLIPRIGSFKETIRVLLPSGAHSLDFSAPYGDLKVHPTTYRSNTSRGSTVKEVVDQSFTHELESFYDSIVHGAPVVNTGRQAAEDVRILAEAFCQSRDVDRAISNGHNAGEEIS